MKKVFSRVAILLAVGGIGITQTGCMGSWKLLTGLYSWNETVTDSKVANQIIFWAFNIIPVYGIAVTVDYVILNLIEFWTGTNPVSMGPDEIEEQEIEHNGTAYLIRATQNKFEVIKANEDALTMIYTPNNETWNLDQEGILQPLCQNLDNNQVKIFLPNGSTQILENNQDGFAALKNTIANFNALASK